MWKALLVKVAFSQNHQTWTLIHCNCAIIIFFSTPFSITINLHSIVERFMSKNNDLHLKNISMYSRVVVEK